MQQSGGIWVVADVSTTRTVLQLMASRLPLKLAVTCFSSLSETAEALRTRVPELVICDLRCPYSATLDLVSRIRSHQAAADVPVIACLEDSDRQRRQEAATAGISDFLSHPVEYWELKHRTQLLLDFHRQRQTLARLKRWHVETGGRTAEPEDSTGDAALPDESAP